MKIVFVASEGVPYSKTGGLADVVGALPKALAGLGHTVEVILPRYRVTKASPAIPQLKSLTLPLSSGFKFASGQDGGERDDVRHYLIECPEFFDRQSLYMENGRDYPDNALRFAAFSLAAIELTKRSPTPPDILHCHDWQTSLVPTYLRNLYQHDKFFEKTSCALTIHNIGYQGLFPPHALSQISLHDSLFTIDGLEFYGKVNLLKAGIIFSDFVTTVSRKYAEEIRTPEFGYGLEGLLRSIGNRLQGIINGVDYGPWDPATDKLIPANYTPTDLKGKQVCKKTLLSKMGVKDPVLEKPVIGIVSRFALQKGFDLIAEAAEELASLDLYVVALGTGEPEYEEIFRKLAEKYPTKFLVKIAYDNVLAHEIEAGADMFLMPSRYEPCGLNQIYSMKYGTIPVVRATGGLEDTVEPFDGKNGTGFKFVEYSPLALVGAVRQAIGIYRQPRLWRQVMQNGMQKDFSWPNSAREYVKIYEALCRSKVERGKR